MQLSRRVLCSKSLSPRHKSVSAKIMHSAVRTSRLALLLALPCAGIALALPAAAMADGFRPGLPGRPGQRPDVPAGPRQLHGRARGPARGLGCPAAADLRVGGQDLDAFLRCLHPARLDGQRRHPALSLPQHGRRRGQAMEPESLAAALLLVRLDESQGRRQPGRPGAGDLRGRGAEPHPAGRHRLLQRPRRSRHPAGAAVLAAGVRPAARSRPTSATRSA